MADLSELIQGLVHIYDSLSIRHQSDYKDSGTQTRNMNQSNVNMFCILPRIALRQIFLCLDLRQDLPRVTATCRIFNTVAHSRTYQIGLYAQFHAREKASNRKKDQAFTFALGASKSSSRSFDDEDMSEQDTLRMLNSANATNSLLAEKMKLRDSRIAAMDAELEKMRSHLKFQHGFAEEIAKKHLVMKREFDEYVHSHPDEQLKICYLADQQAQERQTLKKQISDIEKTVAELKKHRQILRNEVKKLREETGALTKGLESRKKDVERLKEMLVEGKERKVDARS